MCVQNPNLKLNSMAKRTAASELNHDNWNKEEEPEDAGTFSRATEDALKKRVIKVAKRRNPLSSVQVSFHPRVNPSLISIFRMKTEKVALSGASQGSGNPKLRIVRQAPSAFSQLCQTKLKHPRQTEPRKKRRRSLRKKI